MSVGEALTPSDSMKYFPSGNAFGRSAKAKTDASSPGVARTPGARPRTEGRNAKVPGTALKPMEEIHCRDCECRLIHFGSVALVTGVIGTALRRFVVRNGSMNVTPVVEFSMRAEREGETDFFFDRALPDPRRARDILQSDSG